MIKQVSCGSQYVARKAAEKGCVEGVDFEAVRVPGRPESEVAVRATTLQGALFLTLLIVEG